MCGDERVVRSWLSTLGVVLTHEHSECCVESDVIELSRRKSDDDRIISLREGWFIMDTMQALLFGRFRSQYEWPISRLKFVPMQTDAPLATYLANLFARKRELRAPILVHTSLSLVSIPILASFSRNAVVDSLLVLLQKRKGTDEARSRCTAWGDLAIG